MKAFKAKDFTKVLIETYWNVNFFYMKFQEWGTSINRNILECKWISDRFPKGRILEY